jgi:MFS family permease
VNVPANPEEAPLTQPGGESAPVKRARPFSRMVRYTWWKHWPAEAFLGLSNGILGLAEFSSMRSMGAPGWTPQLLIAGQMLWLFAPAWPPLLARMHKQRVFTWLGWISKGPLFLIGFATVVSTGAGGRGYGDWGLFVACLLVHGALDSVYTPHRNAFLRANYPLAVRGRIYGLVGAVSGIAAMLAALFASTFIDANARWIRIVFPLAAAFGVLGTLMFSRIPWRYDGPREAKGPAGFAMIGHSLVSGWRESIATLRRDKGFRDFEIGFMLYGIALLSATPLIVTYAEKTLGVSTLEWSQAQRLAFPVAQLLMIPLVGWLSDKIGVVRVSGLAFLAMGVFFLAMTQASVAWHLKVLYAFYGVGMAGVNVGWSLGPLHFAPTGRAHHYSAVHVACVGIRSLVGPVLGLVVVKFASAPAAFVVSSALEVLAFVWMFRLARKVQFS